MISVCTVEVEHQQRLWIWAWCILHWKASLVVPQWEVPYIKSAALRFYHSDSKLVSKQEHYSNSTWKLGRDLISPQQQYSKSKINYLQTQGRTLQIFTLIQMNENNNSLVRLVVIESLPMRFICCDISNQQRRALCLMWPVQTLTSTSFLYWFVLEPVLNECVSVAESRHMTAQFNELES